jgi:hypothetical protein
MNRTHTTGSTRQRVDALSRLLDTAFRIPGTDWRFGLDPIIGLIPGLGDVVGGGVSTYILYLAARAGAPRSVLARMLVNIGLDTVLGAIPLLGIVFDVGYKANTRNAALLRRYLDDPRPTRSASRGFVIAGVIALLALAALVLWLAVAVIGFLLARLSG